VKLLSIQLVTLIDPIRYNKEQNTKAYWLNNYSGRCIKIMKFKNSLLRKMNFNLKMTKITRIAKIISLNMMILCALAISKRAHKFYMGEARNYGQMAVNMKAILKTEKLRIEAILLIPRMALYTLGNGKKIRSMGRGNSHRLMELSITAIGRMIVRMALGRRFGLIIQNTPVTTKMV
jgi:hypothetical protein